MYKSMENEKQINMQKISILELEYMLGIKQRSLTQTDGFPKYVSKENGIPFYDKVEVENFLGISLSEPLINLKQASEIINKNPSKIMYWVKCGIIPYYRIKESKGSKFYFKKNELETWFNDYFKVEKDDEFYFKGMFTKLAKEGIYRFLNNSKSKILGLGERENYILESVFLNDLTFNQIGNKLDITRDRARQIFYKSIRRINNSLTSISDNFELKKKIEELDKEKELLLNEIKVLKEKITDEDFIKSTQDSERPALEKLLFTDITKLDDYFSVRVMNIFKKYEIPNLGYLIQFQKNRIISFRNLGMKSLDEIIDSLKHLDLKFIEDYEPNDIRGQLIKSITGWKQR